MCGRVRARHPSTVTVGLWSVAQGIVFGHNINLNYWEFKDANGETADLDYYTSGGYEVYTYYVEGYSEIVLTPDWTGTVRVSRDITAWLEGTWDDGSCSIQLFYQLDLV